MGCAPSVGKHETSDLTEEKQIKSFKEEKKSTSSKEKPPEPVVASSQATSPAVQPSPNVKEEEEQDLYVPPLTPRKLKEIEKWLESLPPPSPIPDEEDEHNPSNLQQASICSSASEDKRASSNQPHTLTMEHLTNHVKILSAKDSPHNVSLAALDRTEGADSRHVLTSPLKLDNSKEGFRTSPRKGDDDIAPPTALKIPGLAAPT
eukprot:TRINITY_DN7129_c0_g1_i1.p1 TRINITY_DN7129_c0_g1~~TRINITY_DN7129_c0_g1_i1.p1  ORF type:complete len:205 (+),score=42.20 TRINITY_DN7129_c0_g1_i1:65-679(+)